MVLNEQVSLRVRPALPEDRQAVANFIYFERYVHRHLGWRPPIDWLGEQPFLLAEENGMVQAVLASPPDPPGVAWIHLFAVNAWNKMDFWWERLWEAARADLQNRAPLVCAALTSQSWFRRLVAQSGFSVVEQVAMLALALESPPPERVPQGVRLRQMALDDLEAVCAVDNTAFELLWRQSCIVLEHAYRQSAHATVAEADGRIVGYQMSTAVGPWGGHLARLAVLPAYQGRGIGGALVRDVLNYFAREDIRHVTVNTQEDNPASLHLYRSLGFHLTGEKIPMYAVEVGR